MLADGAPEAKSTRYAHTQKSSTSLNLFSSLKLLFLVRNWHCWLLKAFTCQMRPGPQEKPTKTTVFRHHWQAWKVVRSIAAVCQRPRTPRNWLAFLFRFFVSFLWHANENSLQRWSSGLNSRFSVKLRKTALGSNDLSTLPLNGAGKQWSLHAPLKWRWEAMISPRSP